MSGKRGDDGGSFEDRLRAARNRQGLDAPPAGRGPTDQVGTSALGIGLRVGDDERVVAEDRVGTERPRARRLEVGQPDAGLEPLPVGVHQGDQHDLHAEQAPGQPRDPVEALVGRRVEDAQRPQGGDALGLVHGPRRLAHRVESTPARARYRTDTEVLVR